MGLDRVEWTEIQVAYEKVPYPQMPLMSESQFKSALTHRGMSLFPDGLQHLMDAGIIRPLKEDPPRFHPFQLWVVGKFFCLWSIDLTGQFCFSGLDLEAAYKNLLSRWERLAKDLSGFGHGKVVTEFLRMLPLLFRIESYYLPRVRGTRPGVTHFVGPDLDGWVEWRDKQNLGTWLEEASLSIDEVKKWRSIVLWEAHKLDPADHWYLLIRSADFSRRDQLQGSLRLAYDFYEIAELLRLYITDVSGHPVSKEWDAGGHPDTPWAKRLYGVDEINLGSRELLRALIRQYGLDPSFRVRWMVKAIPKKGLLRPIAKI